jgi:hypothetical protein
MKIKNTGTRFSSVFFAIGLFVAMALPILDIGSASASQLTDRKLTLSSSANGNISTNVAGVAQAAGSGGNGAQARHTFDFTVPTTGNVGSIEFLYCTTPLAGTTCTAPTGMDADTITTVAGRTNISADFVVDGTETDANTICITDPTPESVSASTAVQVYFGQGGGSDWIKNPTDEDTFFTRISTYTGSDCSTGEVDNGTVASSTVQQIDITAKVEETLNFSAGSTVTDPGASCTAFSDSGAVALGDGNGVLSSSTQYDNHSYFRIHTNAINGTSVYYSADTLEDGSNDIDALSSEQTTSAGTEQFGLAIDSSDTQSGDGYSFTDLTAATGYDAGDGVLGTAEFNFDTGSVTTPVELASANDVITCDTGSVRYVANIATNTPAGIYTTTVTYLAVPTY